MKSNLKRILCLILAMAVFGAMAIGSGSDNETAKENTSGVKATEVPAGDKTSSANTAEPSGDDTTPQDAEKVEYSVGETSVVVWKDSIDTNWVKVAIPVTNTGNTNLYLSTSSVDIETADGSLAATLSLVSAYPTVIAPGETAYYFDETTYDDTETEGLKVVPHVKAEKAQVDLIRFGLSDLKVEDTEYFGAHVIGRVENTTAESDSMIYVVANLYDADGRFIGQQFTILTDDLAPGEKVGFKTSSLSWDISAADVGSYEVFAFPLQYQF